MDRKKLGWSSIMRSVCMIIIIAALILFALVYVICLGYAM